MTPVLCRTRQKARARRFSQKGRYSWPSLLIRFAAWNVELNTLLDQTYHLQTGRDLCLMIRDILLANPKRAHIFDDPEAAEYIGAFLDDAQRAFEMHLRVACNREIAIVEYLADGLYALFDKPAH
ncbi:MAG: hypothetical protein AAFR71_16795 [Pseudomonadota bacterium]